MLKPEDCFPGVKVICVSVGKREYSGSTKICVGKEYTIDSFVSAFWDELNNELSFNCISLVEIPVELEEIEHADEDIEWTTYYSISQFILKHPNQEKEISTSKEHELEYA